VSHWLRGLH